jgi:hypothetical protein
MWKVALVVIMVLSQNTVPLFAESQPKCPTHDFSGAVATWVGNNYQAVINVLMPLEEAVDWTQVEFVVHGRITPAFFEEFQFTVALKRNGQIEATAIVPEEGSIGDQLESLKQQYPHLSAKDIAEHVKLRTLGTSHAANHELRRLMIRLQQTNLNTASDPNLICLDGTGYKMSAETSSRKIVVEDGCYDGPEPPLIHFAEEFRRILLGFSQTDYDLIESLRNESFDKSQQLIRNGANLSAYTSEGYDAWFFGFTDPLTLKIMLEKDPDSRKKDYALISAAGMGAPEIVRILLQGGASPNARDRWCDTALILAASYPDGILESLDTTSENYIQVISALISFGADLEAKDQEGNTAFLKAVDFGHVEIAQMLINAGADIYVRNNKGETALMIATYAKDSKMLNFLQKQ